MSKEKIIKTDFDTPEDEYLINGGLYPYDPTYEDIDLKDDPMSVFQYIRKYNQGLLIIDPDFQRNLVWSLTQKSQFIESIILNFPLPPFYLFQDKKGKLTIIDGLQRTTALFEYLTDKFELTGLEALPSLNKKKFSDLTDFQSKIEDKKLLFYILKPSTPVVVIHDLFNRINTNGTQLTRQEVRNCVLLGKSTKLLKELSENSIFRSAIDNGISPKRMKDREAVLRYISFKIQDYKTDFQNGMSSFLENAMRKINQLNDSEIEKIKEDFIRVMKYTFNFFEKNNFRIATSKTRGTINVAILESVAIFFSDKTDEFLNNNKEAITNNYQKLLQNDDYLKAVKSSTSSNSHVHLRFSIANETLGENCHD